MGGKVSAAFFSLEMPGFQLWTRILSEAAEVPGERLRSGHLTIEEINRILQCSKDDAEMELYVDDRAGLSVEQVRAEARQIHRDPNTPPLGLIVVDYLQIMSGSGRSREQEISKISSGLKALAKELKVPVIALSQLNRGLESRANKRPMMSDLRESGAIEQDADVILFVYRDEMYNDKSEDKGIAELIIAKQRNGPLGTVRLRFNPETTAFGDV